MEKFERELEAAEVKPEEVEEEAEEPRMDLDHVQGSRADPISLVDDDDE